MARDPLPESIETLAAQRLSPQRSTQHSVTKWNVTLHIAHCVGLAEIRIAMPFACHPGSTPLSLPVGLSTPEVAGSSPVAPVLWTSHFSADTRARSCSEPSLCQVLSDSRSSQDPAEGVCEPARDVVPVLDSRELMGVDVKGDCPLAGRSRAGYLSITSGSAVADTTPRRYWAQTSDNGRRASRTFKGRRGGSVARVGRRATRPSSSFGARCGRPFAPTWRGRHSRRRRCRSRRRQSLASRRGRTCPAPVSAPGSGAPTNFRDAMSQSRNLPSVLVVTTSFPSGL